FLPRLLLQIAEHFSFAAIRRTLAVFRPSDDLPASELIELLLRKAEPILIDFAVVLSDVAGRIAQLRAIDGEARNDIGHRYRAEVPVGNVCDHLARFYL